MRLAIQRQVVPIFADQHMRQQRLGRHAAIDRALRRGRLHHGLLAHPAAVARTADDLHAELGRHMVQHLGTVLADRMQRRATTGARLVGDIDYDLDPGQVCRQCSAVTLWRCGPRDWLSRFDLGGLLGQGLLQVFDPFVQGFVAELFRPAAEAVSEQTSNQHLQPRDLGLGFEQQVLQRRRILGQKGLIGGHSATLNHRCESGPMTLA